MKTISVVTVPFASQRYPTVGDYWEQKDSITFSIAKMPDERYEWLILVHEIVEYVLVKIAGIKIQDIDAFDKQWEKDEMEGEPGESKNAPYHIQHMCADVIERCFAVMLCVDWAEYSLTVEKISKYERR